MENKKDYMNNIYIDYIFTFNDNLLMYFHFS